MIDWLYTLAELQILAISAGVLVLLMVLLPTLVGLIPTLKPNEFNDDFVLRIQTTLITMASLVLTFTLVQADNNFRWVDSLVSKEAAQIDQLDRLLTRYGNVEATAIRPELLVYAQSIVKEEWPAMVRGQGSDATGRAFSPVSRHILAVSPSTPRQSLIFSEMLKSLDSIAESRAARLSTLSVGLPPIYWQVVLFAVAMWMFSNCTIKRTPFRTTILATQAAVLGAFIGFVFIMDQPFKGQTAVNPNPVVQAIARMASRTE